jgi:hypothetical protein
LGSVDHTDGALQALRVSQLAQLSVVPQEQHEIWRANLVKDGFPTCVESRPDTFSLRWFVPF